MASECRINITGFGACIIRGHPWSIEHSFLTKFTQLVPGAHPAKLVAVSGLTAPTAMRLIPRVLATRPHIVVVQLCSTDASVPLKKFLLTMSRGITSASETSGERVSTVPSQGLRSPRSSLMSARDRGKATALTQFQWSVEGAARWLMRAKPVTPAREYVDAIITIARALAEASITGLFLTPFRSGDFYSDRLAASHAAELLRLDLAPGCAVDARTPLLRYPAREVLLADGLHLTTFAHTVVAEALHQRWRGLREGG